MKKPATLTFIFLILGSILFAQKQSELVPMAKEHYTAKDILSLSPKDIEKINFYYTSTYNIDANNTYYQAFINKHCKGIFDITYFENMRAKGYESWYTDEEFPGLKITLMSWNDIEKAYREIEKAK
ncbi:MAG: hypothetical protein WCK02_17675 [Bacteroidota bacterium]